ncbi:Tad domain-containing protein [Rhizobium sp. 9140]|uniref:Tad domain-containing protein n=1 Tax=Rhizobium sp. 9140 TaxID=1761900 RepID=UPI00079AFF45|nr:Tad domain-containing protein [Rhizobium sp. 9140]CZT35757.1 Putative Flp pilus-assembly TadE/G-like [Rhizobium sp. 9140]
MRDIRTDDEGSVAIMSVFAILLILMISALVLETSSLSVDKLRAQRTADIANLAAANTGSPIVNGAPSNTALATARQMAIANGFPPSGVVTRVTAGRTGLSELSTDIRYDSPLAFGQLLTASPTVPVDGSSSARIIAMSAEGDCIRSMTGPVNIYGNAVIDGPECYIGAATYLHVCGNASVAARKATVHYPRTSEKAYICKEGQIDPPLSSFTFDTTSVDLLATDPRIVAIKARLKAMTKWAYGTKIPKTSLQPTTPNGKDESYADTTVSLSATRLYGTLTISNSTLDFTGTGAPDPNCLTPTTISGNLILSGVNRLTFASGCYAIGGYILNEDGASTRFDPLPGARVTFAFKQYIDNRAAKLSFGDMTLLPSGDVRNPEENVLTTSDMAFSLLGDVRNADGGTLTFGDGSFRFGAGIINGSGTLSFGNGAYYVNGGSIINGAGSMTFGNGAFYLWGGSLANSSTGSVTFGNGGFYFYGGTVTNVRGRLTFGDGPFEFWGGSLALNPGSDTVFGFGDMNFYGGTAYFHGASTLIGRNAIGDSVGGSSSVFFYGGSFSMKSERLVAVGTTLAFYGGSVSLYGVGEMNVTAPTGDLPAFGYKNILFYIYGGAFSLYQSNVTDILSGIIYVPGTNISIYGSQTVTIPDGGCFQVVGGVVDIYQNASLKMRPCSGGAAVPQTVSLTR